MEKILGGRVTPVNVTGATGATALVGHIPEESGKPISHDIWQRVEKEILETSGPES